MTMNFIEKIEEIESQKVNVKRVEVNIMTIRGNPLKGYLIVPRGERLSDSLNDNRMFMVFESNIDGEIHLIRKAAIDDVHIIQKTA